MSEPSKPIPSQQFADILGQIQSAKQKAYTQINRTLVELYWNIGKYVSTQVAKAQWGKSTVEQLADYIRQNEPSISGFTASNIWRMKQFYEIYQEDEKLATLWRELPWSHNRRIMTLKTTKEREFYLQLCNQKKYAYRELERIIKTSTYERTMLSGKNLSPAVAELPQSTEGVFKDSYVFEFLDLPVPHQETCNKLWLLRSKTLF